jgi:hypothetical protein
MTTWQQLITQELEKNSENWNSIVNFIGLKEGYLYQEFLNDFGKRNLDNFCFTIWTVDFVYFPVVYDSVMSCGSAPRYFDSTEEPMRPVGGGGFAFKD